MGEHHLICEKISKYIVDEEDSTCTDSDKDIDKLDPFSDTED